MTDPTERDIERLLSTGEPSAPAPELAKRIKREIPDGLRLDRAALEAIARNRIARHVPAYRQFVLLAALLFVTIALGTFGLRALIEQKAEEERQAAMIEALERDTSEGKEHAERAAPEEQHDTLQPGQVAPLPAGTLRSTGDVDRARRGSSANASVPAPDRREDHPLTVTVTSTSGEALAGVMLRLTRLDPPTAERWTGVTAADGSARLARPRPGLYRLDAAMPGFKPGVVLSLRVQAGRPSRVALTLEPEAPADTPLR
ncbi:MAG: carboxypeptidase-like regulatory domain-containing protein [Acidobacteriota bacterium]